MLRHNLLLLYRNFKRFRATFFINLIGLSTGLACTLLIYLWVYDEWKIDKFHEKDKRLYQVMERQQHDSGIGTVESTPWLLAETLEQEFPEVEHAVMASLPFWFGNLTLSTRDTNAKARVQYASKNFFNIFSYPLLQGSANSVLADKNSIVISETLAMTLFKTTDQILGRTVEFQRSREFIVSGVFKDVPRSSSLYFDFVLSDQLLFDERPQIKDWKNAGPYTFVLLKEGADEKAFGKKIAGIIKSKTGKEHRTLFMRKFSDGYLYGFYENGIQTGGRIDYVVQFSVIALGILFIACINFMNLSTAKASRRLKEVGIKKAVGAGRRTLITQYLGESMLMSLIALVISILLVDLTLPMFNDLTGKQLALQFNGTFVITIICVVLLTGLLAGSYPALYLSAFNPVAVLKGKLNTSLGELWARKGLVMFQFTISVILITCVAVIYSQIQYVQSRKLGFNKDNVIYFEMEGKIKENPETFVNEMKELPGVVEASTIAQSMVGGGNTTNLSWEGKDPDAVIPFAFRPVNYGVIEMLGLKVKEGRAFSREHGDSAKVIFNEAGIEAMGLKDPVGKTIDLGPYKLSIAGVVEDFHFESLHSNVAPLFFVLAPQYTEKVIAKIEGARMKETLDEIQAFYRQFNPGFAFDYRFMDEDFQAQYVAEQRVAVLSKYFAVLAILISGLGLFGLASFTAERRLKEIGIRKVLGAGELRLVYLLSADFTKIVLVAIVIAVPVSYYFSGEWLNGFAYKISLSWWYFTGAGLLALVIAWLTVGSQAIRAARVNPTQCLKDE
jgi:putative ABC transport system permease protein